MTHIFEDYREIDNVRDKLDFVIELVNEAPRRVFLTKEGKVQAVVLSSADYKSLWQLEFEHLMALSDEEVARGEVFTTEEVIRHVEERLERKRRIPQ
jgi:PHD/YefM family antitoxin component YafN of YafNO toxin-antitoxin module